MDSSDDKLDQIYRLTKETNQMLRTMRRNAFLGGLIKFVIYAVLLLAPVWFYMTYLNDSVQQLMKTYQQVSGAGANASAQLGGIESQLRSLQDKLPEFMKNSETGQQ